MNSLDTTKMTAVILQAVSSGIKATERTKLSDTPGCRRGVVKGKGWGSIIIVNTVFTTIHPQEGPQTIYSVGPITVVASTGGDHHAE